MESEFSLTFCDNRVPKVLHFVSALYSEAFRGMMIQHGNGMSVEH